MPRLHGSASLRKAYADWANTGFGRYRPALANNGVDLVQIAHGVAGKNAADIRMAVDVMDDSHHPRPACIRSPSASHAAVVDSGLTPGA